MSLLILQIIIKQWDKSQRTDDHVAQRAEMPDHYSIDVPPAFYLFDNQCVIDQHGGDLLGDRVTCTQAENGKVAFDRFEVCLNSKALEYTGNPDSADDRKTIGSLDNNWIQCKYDWRYGVYEGGFYYWLYEEVTLNAISIGAFNQNVFLDSNPTTVFTG